MADIKAKITYMFFSCVDKRFITADVLTSSDENVAEREMQLCSNFLYGDSPKFPAVRKVRDVEDFVIRNIKISKCCITESIFSDTAVCGVYISLTVETDTVDDLVYLRQIFLSTAKVSGDNSLSDLADEIYSKYNVNAAKANTAYLIEINRFDDEDNALKLINDNAAQLYGAFTGDEGYNYIPSELCIQRMENGWGSRDFMRAVVYRNNFLLINFNEGNRINEYLSFQKEFGGKFYGEANEYFFVDCKVAGVNHGVLFACETGMVAKTISENALNYKFIHNSDDGEKISRAIQTTKELRLQMILTLNRLETVEIAEISELEALVNAGLEIAPLIDKIKYILELLESELDLLYQTSTNKLVNLLTILGLILSAGQLLVAFL